MPEPITLFLTTIDGATGEAEASESARVLRDLLGSQDAQLGLRCSIDKSIAAPASPQHRRERWIAWKRLRKCPVMRRDR
jgi:hypothetical protein